MKRERMEFINLYKFVCSIIIACFLHYRVLLLEMFGYSYSQTGDLAMFLMAGTSNYLVEFFFILSGLLFAHTYKVHIESGDLRFKDFFDKRLRRLLPLLIVTTVMMFFLRIALEQVTGLAFFPGNVSFDELINSIVLLDSTLCGVRMNPSGWYIPKLLVCYVIAYFLTRWHGSIGKITFVIPIILGVIIRITKADYPFFEFHMSRAYIAFFGGIILCGIIVWVQNHLKPMLAVIGGHWQ